MASIRKHSGIGIVSAAFEVELQGSESTCLKYPVRGLLTITETGPSGNINTAVFEQVEARTGPEGMYGAPVPVRNPVFVYDGDHLVQPKYRAAARVRTKHTYEEAKKFYAEYLQEYEQVLGLKDIVIAMGKASQFGGVKHAIYWMHHDALDAITAD